MTPNDVLNLDGFFCAVELLGAVGSLTGRGSRLYRRYARYKARAMNCRLNGLIDLALRYEATCDRVYAKLPKELQW